MSRYLVVAFALMLGVAVASPVRAQSGLALRCQFPLDVAGFDRVRTHDPSLTGTLSNGVTFTQRTIQGRLSWMFHDGLKGSKVPWHTSAAVIFARPLDPTSVELFLIYPDGQFLGPYPGRCLVSGVLD